jgi:gamma-glutamylcyclotransferase (GGCT)/AIG2-like uncharacterized protein YtfP
MKYYAYFAYGSNLNMDQMEHRCPHSRPIGSAILPGYRLEFRANGSGMGFATVSPAPGKRVHGGLWAIAEIDLPRLDRYEGYPSLYTRRMLPVQYEGIDRKALTYIMTPGHILAEPGGFYIDICLDGYRDFGLDKRAFWGGINRTRMLAGGNERRRTAW